MVANAQYNRTYVETALAEPTVPPLSAEQNEALDLVSLLSIARHNSARTLLTSIPRIY